MLLPDKFVRVNTRLNAMLIEAGREPGSVRRSMMTGCVFAKDDATLQRKVVTRGTTLEELQGRGIVAGGLEAVKEQLAALEEAGLHRVMLQWLDLDDLESLERLAMGVL
jgi:hypothetical protein